MARLFLVVAAALILCTAASAATIDDLRALGYTVGLSSPGPPGENCPVYFVSGHGVSIYVNCHTQDAIDSLANPARICNADWQLGHPDQLAAWQTITSKGWGVGGDQCADTYTVTNPNDGTTAYSGSGAGLPQFAQTHDAPPSSQTAPPGAQPAPVQNCLPLCPAGPIVIISTPTDGQHPVTVTAASAIAPVTDPALAPAAAAILFPDLSAGYLLRAGYGTGGALNP